MPPPKSLRDLLREGDPSAKKRRNHYLDFIVEQSAIHDAIEEHWPIRDIWKALHSSGRVSMSYSTLRKLIRDNPRPQAPPAAPGAPSKTVNPLPKREGFHHNPNPDISDLV